MIQDLLSDEKPNIRTQISLTKTLKRAIEIKGRFLGESLSEYLRKAAALRLLSEEEEEKELKIVGRNFIGGSKWRKDHPNWPNKNKVRKWSRKIREEWGK